MGVLVWWMDGWVSHCHSLVHCVGATLPSRPVCLGPGTSEPGTHAVVAALCASPLLPRQGLSCPPDWSGGRGTC
ncbi:hypothetical protein QBC39DRAFT_161051 [Podospora conica]|nr:hypothetical protein QBC39DRAFT_161051 [Schizothecium conicum]